MGKVLFTPHYPSSIIFPGRPEQPPPNFNSKNFGKKRYPKVCPSIKSSFAEKALEQGGLKDCADFIR